MGTLTDAKLRGAKATGKAYKLSDGEQLYLHVSPSGGRSWRMNYQFGRNDKGRPAQKTLTIGPYPAISLKDARDARDVAKSLLAKGLEPKPTDLFSKGGNSEDLRVTFETIGREWVKLQSIRWSKVYAKNVVSRLEQDVFPALGLRPIEDISAAEVFQVLSRIVDRGAIETAHRVCQRISAIFIYAVAMGKAENDPAGKLAIALPKTPKKKSQPAITDLNDLRQMMVDCEAQRCRASTKLALRFIALTAVRANELHGARWAEFEGLDTAEALWRIPAARMKGDEDRKAEEDGDHLVPLAPEAVEVLECMKLLTGNFELVWPGERHHKKQMSENTLRALLIRAGYYQRHVPHGFRSAFSTIMNERCERAWRKAGHKGASPDRAIIDLMLAHVPSNKVEGAYNRAAYMERRREIACEWAQILLKDMWPPAVHMGQPIRWAATGPGRPRR
jgi:integrase